MSAFCLFLSWYTQSRLAYFICALLFSILIVSYILFRLQINNIECLRKSGATASEDDVLDVGITLANSGFFSEDSLSISDSFPTDISSSTKHVFVGMVGKGAVVNFNYKGYCQKRGVYTLGPVIVGKNDFFGLFRKERRFYPPSKLIVFPRVFKVGFFPLGLRSSMPRYGRMVSRRSGEYEEFQGIREYVKEDGLRKIHWPLSAKHEKLMVRHFEQSSSYMGSILLDLKEADNIGMGKDTTFEYAVKISASVSDYLIQKGGNVQLLAYGDEPVLTGFGQSKEHHTRILETLAELEPEGQLDFPAALTRLEPIIPPSSSLLVFLLDNDTNSQNMVRSLAAKKDLFVIEVIMSSSSFVDLAPAKEVLKISYEGPNLIKYYCSWRQGLEGIFSQSSTSQHETMAA